MKWLILSVAIFILGFFNIFAPLRGGVQYIFNPIQYGIQQVAVSLKGWGEFYTNLQKIRDENLDLLEENELLKSRVVELEQFEIQNKLLKEQLDVELESDNEKLVLVKILGDSGDKTGSSVFVNKGSYHGISSSDILIKGKYLVGVVKDVSNFRSRIELITSPSISLSVMDLRTGIEGIAVGQFGTSMLVNNILPEDDVKVGDIFVSSGRDGVVPSGYIVGEVSKVGEDSAEVLKKVSLDALLDFGRINEAFVLTKDN